MERQPDEYSPNSLAIAAEFSGEARLNEKEMSNLLSGAANHANKLVLLAAMVPGELYGRSGTINAQMLLRSAQGSYVESGWVPNANGVFQYLENSLSPVGLVAKEYINEEQGTIGYGLTERGARHGKALAGYLLDFADRKNLALSQIFGETTSRNPEARSSGIRWSIFQDLATRSSYEPITITNLADSIGMDVHRTIHSLNEIADVGLIHYEQGSKRSQRYAINTEALSERLPVLRGKTADIARFILENHAEAEEEGLVVTVASLASILTENDPSLNNPRFRGYVKTILGNWEKPGVTQRLISNGGDARVWVDDDQQSTIFELVSIIEKVRDTTPEALEEGLKLAKNALNNPQLVSRLLGHEKRVSPHYLGQQNARRRGERVLQILSKHGTEMTYQEVQAELQGMGDIVSKGGLARTLQSRKDIVTTGDRYGGGRKGTISLAAVSPE